METLEQVKNKISIVDYVQRYTSNVQLKSLGNNNYRVNPCPICGHKDHFTLYGETNTYTSFNNCCEGGDIIKYMEEVEGIPFFEAKAKLYSITNTPLEEYKPTARKQQEKPQEKKPSKEELQQVSEFIEQGIKQMQEQDKQELANYLNSRNIDKAAIDKYNLFMAKDEANNERVYIPIYEQGNPIAYIGRAIDSNAKLRYKNSSGTMQPFNIDYISTEAAEEDEPLFICEGIFDAISIEEQGKKAIALNSTSNVNKFLDALKEHKDTASKYKFIIATDTDEARTRCKRKTNSRINKAKHSKQLFEDTEPI